MCLLIFSPPAVKDFWKESLEIGVFDQRLQTVTATYTRSFRFGTSNEIAMKMTRAKAIAQYLMSHSLRAFLLPSMCTSEERPTIPTSRKTWKKIIVTFFWASRSQWLEVQNVLWCDPRFTKKKKKKKTVFCCIVLTKSTLGTRGVPSLEFDVGPFTSMGLGNGFIVEILCIGNCDEKTGLETWTPGCRLPSRFFC